MDRENLYTMLEKKGMSPQEINQFIKCMENGLIVSKSVRDASLLRTFFRICQKHDFKFDYDQQQIILNALQQGMSVDNVTKLADPKYNNYVMREISVAFMHGKDITKYVNDLPPFLAPYIRLMAINGVPDESILWFIKKTKGGPLYSEENKINELRFCLEDEVPLSKLSKVENLTFSDLRKIRLKYKRKNA